MKTISVPYDPTVTVVLLSAIICLIPVFVILAKNTEFLYIILQIENLLFTFVSVLFVYIPYKYKRFLIFTMTVKTARKNKFEK